jgi:hypothetical protein
MTIGGGPVEPVSRVLARALAYATGLPLGLGAGVLLAVGTGLIAAGVVRRWRRGDDLWLFYLTGIVLSPVALLALQPGELRFERYFLVNATLFLLFGAGELTALAMRGRGWRLLGVVLLAGCLAGSGVRIARLLVEGRGQYRAAIRHMAEATPTPTIVVGSDHDFRNALVLRYHAERLGLGARFVYAPRGAWPAGGPHWVLLHRFEDQAPPGATIADPAGSLYRLEAVYPSAPLSGWRWYLFRGRLVPP